MKTNNLKISFTFIIQLTLLLVVAWTIQSYFTTKSLLLPYLFNFIITLVGFVFIRHQQKKRMESLGFVFMALSGFKFLLFFIFYKPLSLAPEIKKELFLDFFIPYAICLGFEVYFLVKILNRDS